VFLFLKNKKDASWCSHCRDLAPTWETLAEVMNIAADEAVEEKVEAEGHDWTDEEYEFAHKMERPVMIAKVDCVLHQELCRRFNVRAYPSLQLFVGGKLEDEYRDHRTVMDMVHWLAEQEGKHKRGTQGKMDSMTNVAIDRMDLSEAEIAWFEEMKKHKRQHPPNLWIDEDHPGCQMAGHLMLDRVPGNFHIQARSAHHDLVPHMTNVSHIVHHLSIGEPIVQRLVTTGQRVIPAEVKSKLSPMDGNIYLTQELHEAYHHYLKVVTTNVDGMITNSQTGLKAYQILGSSQLAFYRNDVIPEAKFIYDLSPISVAYRKTSRKWYDYLTSLMAIIGGSFTVFGMCESGISAVVARKKRY
jgi:thiol-disulfide isomerase/thioredoxin